MGKFECNACPETEGCVAPCRLEFPDWRKLPRVMYCPISGEEIEWDEVKPQHAKQAEQGQLANCHLWDRGKQCQYVAAWVCADQCCAVQYPRMAEQVWNDWKTGVNKPPVEQGRCTLGDVLAELREIKGLLLEMKNEPQ